MARRNKSPQFAPGQRLALRELRQLAAAHPDLVSIVGRVVPDDGFGIQVVIRLSTDGFAVVEGGLPVSGGHEDVLVHIPRSFPWRPPEATVAHTRFAGQAHVLEGHRLCVYLDASREWHPEHGMRGFLDRLWNWFADGAAGRFDPTTALYHPVGGVLHRTAGTPTVVVRRTLVTNGKAFSRAALSTRSPTRIDVTRWDVPRATELAQVIMLSEPIPYGAGLMLPEALGRIAEAGRVQADGLATLLAWTAARNAPGTPLYMILAVPRPGPAGGHHLLAGRLSPSFTDVLRAAAAGGGPMLKINVSAIPAATPIEWCHVSDERPETASRRDSTRPTSRFLGREVEVWGCGGLGSWVAEFIARAGAARLVVRDPGDVQGGLLVRQNYVETDVGGNKADRLAARLRQISDDLTVESDAAGAPGGPGLPDCDLIVDATVNNTVGLYLDSAAKQTPSNARPMLAQVSTDVRTATLGLVTVSAVGHPAGPADVDRRTGARVLADGSLERFHALWQEPADGDEMIPARGCSVPTFHGSAADVAGVAASLTSLLAPHLDSTMSGTHLVALPHAPGNGPHHRYLPATAGDE